ncbi:3-ketoacyl-ACP reductase (plasmid) [Mesorhizobium sp. 131-3-5]|uniref:3-oxoacyl-ACP reductase FabG n=1 Tax=Mesorhizobium sp. 131-3-5 TaxID=2744520 RepID=UPI0018ECF471|nr:3-oxoacyl-ACP reductase FabG [Mesorhizobium sp. 131-3-5]BCH12347.1 3-ketoacyl-ACP reductase [Mesorhizobium sp. 131-3-5]
MTIKQSQGIAIVSGGTSGIGLASAEKLLTMGYRVAVFGSQEERVGAARKSLSERFGAENVIVESVDLRSAPELSKFFNYVIDAWGAPDVVICNAGYSPKHNGRRLPFASIPTEEWNDVIAVNLTGVMLCCQLSLPHMAKRGFGRIVIIGSIAARAVPRLAGASYVASKAALAGLNRSLVAEYGSMGITINTIAPGNILTGMIGDIESDVSRTAIARIPAGRFGTAQDIASVVGFLVSKEGEFINGAVIDVNGGEYLPL